MRRVIASVLLVIVLCAGCDKVNGAQDQEGKTQPRFNCVAANVFFAGDGASTTIQC